MPTQVQFRRGTTAQNNSFTGAAGEITVNTSNATLRVHDGTTAGGRELATVLYVNNEIANVIGAAPDVLDTLNEIAAAINDDPGFFSNVATSSGLAFNQANAAYDRANVAVTYAGASFDKANTLVTTVAGVTSTTISNAQLAAGITQAGILTTANVAESGNLYYTTVRANADIDNRVTKSFVESLNINVPTTKLTGNILSSQIEPTAVTAGTYGGAAVQTVVTIDAQGRITNAANVTSTVANSNITGLITDAQIAAVSSNKITGNIIASQIEPTGVTASTYGGADKVSLFTVDQQGRLTSASNVTISIPSSAINTDVALGTQTSGAYVANLVAGTGVTLTGLGNEGTTPTIAIGQAVATTSDVQFAKVNASGQTRITDATNSTGVNTGALIVTGGASIGGNLYLSGNLFIAGTSNTLNSNVITLEDPIIFLSDNSTTDVLDIGLIASFNNGTQQHGGFIRDASDGVWKLFANVIAEPNVNAVVDFTNATYQTIKVGDVQSATGTFTGNVSTGNVSGTVGTFTNSRLGTVQSGTWNGSSIGTSFTDAKVTSVNGSVGDVTGLATTANSLSQFASTTSTELRNVISDETGTGNLVFSASPTFTGNVNVTGNINATQYITSPYFYSESDMVLKENIFPISSPLEKVLSLFGVNFDWKRDKTKGVGVIAQDVERVLPEAVTTNSNGNKIVSYSSLIPLLIEAIKEQQSDIEYLKKLIEDK